MGNKSSIWKKLYRFLFIIRKESEMKLYGFNHIIREYTGFPSWLALPCHMEHGWTALDKPLNSDLIMAETKPLMLVFSKRRADEWKEKSNTPVVIMGAPFIHYRKMHNIEVKKEANGTIAFPSHSCENVKSAFNIGMYCDQLLALPEEFHPITVCLHDHDIKLGRKNIFQKKGLNVVSAGEQFSPNFAKDFYNILSGCQYTTSNVVGSYTFYSIEMGIPFFIYGQTPLMMNNGKDINVPVNYSISNYKYGVAAQELFNTGQTGIISEGQRIFVQKELGEIDCLPKGKLRSLLYKAKAKEILKTARTLTIESVKYISAKILK